jgi:hypothetical protein
MIPILTDQTESFQSISSSTEPEAAVALAKAVRTFRLLFVFQADTTIA